MEQPKKQPAYWIAALPLMLGAMTCGGGLLATQNQVKAMPRVVIPGDHVVMLEGGRHIGYLEHRSVVDGQVVAGDPIGRCSLRDSSGTRIELRPTMGETTYAFGGYAGRAIFEVDVPMTGDYRVSCESSGMGALAFGGGLGGLIALSVLGGLAGAVGSGGLLWRARRRRTASVPPQSPEPP